jgi:hypothetical protein
MLYQLEMLIQHCSDPAAVVQLHNTTPAKPQEMVVLREDKATKKGRKARGGGGGGHCEVIRYITFSTLLSFSCAYCGVFDPCKNG